MSDFEGYPARFKRAALLPIARTDTEDVKRTKIDALVANIRSELERSALGPGNFIDKFAMFLTHKCDDEECPVKPDDEKAETHASMEIIRYAFDLDEIAGCGGMFQARMQIVAQAVAEANIPPPDKLTELASSGAEALVVPLTKQAMRDMDAAMYFGSEGKAN